MNNTPIPITTEYNDYRFRSRLEARWAVFFDSLGITYKYEEEGYDLGDGVRYLPDFWLPRHDCWIEIKKGEPSAEELHTAGLLAAQSGKWVDIFAGDPHPGTFKVIALQSTRPQHQPSLWPYVERAVREKDEGLLHILSFARHGLYWREFVPLMGKWGNHIPHESKVPYFQQERLLTVCPQCLGLVFGWPGGLLHKYKIIECSCGELHDVYTGETERMPDHEGWCHFCEQQGTADHPRLSQAFKAARQARFEHGERPQL